MGRHTEVQGVGGVSIRIRKEGIGISGCRGRGGSGRILGISNKSGDIIHTHLLVRYLKG